MKKVVWGTGGIAAKFVGTLRCDDITFFIDSDERKRGKEFMGRQIRMPNEIVNWDELFIYIQYNYFDEISSILREKGLVEGKNFTKYPYPKQIVVQDIDEDCDIAYDFLKSKRTEMEGKNWYCGAVLSIAQEELKNCYNALQKSLQTSFLTISREVYMKQEEAEKYWGTSIFVLPKIFAADAFEIVTEQEDETDYGKLLKKEYPQLLNVSKEYMGIYAGLKEGRAHLYTYKQAVFADRIIKLLCPKMVFIMGSFHTPHRVLAHVCCKHGVSIIYTHPGALPQTWSFDVGGEMGESLPAVYASEFARLPVTETEMEKAQKVWVYLRESKVNRKIQPKTDWHNKILYNIKRHRPTVLYAGQNDVLSGLAYYGEHAKMYHSPIFPTSIAAIPVLAELAQKNDWNFIYKPHPIYLPTKEQLETFPKNVIYVEMADINDLVDFADTIITILSSTSYVALIREKPVVMLGYNQLKGKGCTYEAFEENAIENAIRKALEEGFAQRQRKAFIKHIAQLLKYYLYTDKNDDELGFGRFIPKEFNVFYDLERLLKEN